VCDRGRKQRRLVIGFTHTHSVGAVTQSESWPPAREFATYLDHGRCPALRSPTVLLRASEGMLSHWSRLAVFRNPQSTPGPLGYGSFPLCVIHEEGLCPSSGNIIRLMMMMMMMKRLIALSFISTKFYGNVCPQLCPFTHLTLYVSNVAVFINRTKRRVETIQINNVIK
jgi:hypothetical protein